MSVAATLNCNNRIWIISLSFHVLFFAFILGITHPVFGSSDDTFLAYLLGGGLGYAATEMLHYGAAFHPLLGWMVKQFNLLFPTINGFSVLLYFGFFIAFTVLFVQILNNRFSGFRIFLYACLCLVFEAWFLIRPSFTVLALVLSLAAYLKLYVFLKSPEHSFRHLIGPLLLFAFSALLRLPAFLVFFIPALVLFLPYLKARIKPALLFAALFFGVLFSLNLSQRLVYQNKIKEWYKQESYRNTYFSKVNRSLIKPVNETGSCPDYLLANSIFIDKESLTESYLKSVDFVFVSEIKQRLFNAEMWKWFLINNKLFLLFPACLLFFFLFASKGIKYPMVFLFSIILIQFALFILFFKLPPYIVPFLCFAFCVFLLFEIKEDKRRTIMLVLPVLVLSAWSVRHLISMDSEGRERNQILKSKIAELEQFPEAVFMATDDLFPLADFYVFDHPKAFSLPNLFNKDRLLTDRFSFNLQHEIRQRGAEHMYLLGPNAPNAANCLLPGFQIFQDTTFKANPVFVIRP